MDAKKAVVVLPTYNERDGIREIVPEIFKYTQDIPSWEVHILVADDSSPDGTADEVRLLQKKYPNTLHLQVNKGKVGLGQAYLNAFAHAIERYKPDVIFEMDADGQHPADILPNFLRKIDEGADFVIGSRYIKGGSIPSHWSLWRKFTSVVGNIFAQLTFMNFKVRDWTSGYRCIRAPFLKEVIPAMKGHTGYVFQVALLDNAFKSHLKIAETPLNFTDRLNGESKMQSFRFMFDTLWYIFTHSSFVKFSITGFSGFLVDFGVAAVLIATLALHKPTANAISAEIAIVFNFIINNFWSFNHKKLKGGYLQKFLKFNLVSSGAILIQWLGLIITLDMFGDVVYTFPWIQVPSWVIYKMLIIGFLVIPYSYLMYNLFIWKAPAQARA
jgi:dolichol-phosphate mannosyltransferase